MYYHTSLTNNQLSNQSINMALNTKQTANFNVVSINLGGMDCNPFEYISEGYANKGVWDFKAHLSGLKKIVL